MLKDSKQQSGDRATPAKRGKYLVGGILAVAGTLAIAAAIYRANSVKPFPRPATTQPMTTQPATNPTTTPPVTDRRSQPATAPKPVLEPG